MRVCGAIADAKQGVLHVSSFRSRQRLRNRPSGRIVQSDQGRRRQRTERLRRHRGSRSAQTVLKATIPVSRAPRVAIVFVSVQAIVLSDGTMVDLPAGHPIDHRSLATKQRVGGHTGSGNRAEAKPKWPGCGSLIQPPQEMQRTRWPADQREYRPAAGRRREWKLTPRIRRASSPDHSAME